MALHLGPLALDSLVIKGFEEGSDLVLFLELELGGVDGGEREGALVAGLEAEIRREEVGGVEVEVRSALRAAVDRSHWRGRERDRC